MDEKQKQTFLRRYQDLAAECKELSLEIMRIRQDAIAPGSQRIDGMPHGHNGLSDLSGFAVKIDEAICKLQDTMDLRTAAYMEIEAAVDQLENPLERRVLRMKYLRGMSWGETADQIGYSKRQTLRIRDCAIEHLDIHLDSNNAANDTGCH